MTRDINAQETRSVCMSEPPDWPSHPENPLSAIDVHALLLGTALEVNRYAASGRYKM